MDFPRHSTKLVSRNFTNVPRRQVYCHTKGWYYRDVVWFFDRCYGRPRLLKSESASRWRGEDRSSPAVKEPYDVSILLAVDQHRHSTKLVSRNFTNVPRRQVYCHTKGWYYPCNPWTRVMVALVC
jgi:hypothetical protein